MKKNNKGFTLAELLIVVAIIAVLVAVSIPIFTAQLEKSREATDIANIRSAYAEAVAAQLSDIEGVTDTATLQTALGGKYYNAATGKFDATGTELKGTNSSTSTGTVEVAGVTYDRSQDYSSKKIEATINADGDVELNVA